MRRILTIAALVLAAFLSAQAQEDAFHGILPVTDPAFRKSLNGTWDFKLVEGISDDRSVPPSDGSWSTIPVPGCWEIYGFWHSNYARTQALTGYYHTTFTIPKEWDGHNIAIRLDGVLYAYDLWINGRHAGFWQSAYNTAIFDITPFIDNGTETQELSMRVITRHDSLGFDINDDWSPCGIFRDVTLMAVPRIHLSDLTIHPRLSGEVEIDTDVANADNHTRVIHEIFDADGRKVGAGRVDDQRLWTAETPYLYTLRTTLKQRGKTLQVFEHKFGFRELTIEDKVVKLNGQPIKLRGVANHATDPNTGKVITDSLLRIDMELMKAASVNCIRTSHYPREPRFYELADSLGFYIIDEVPFGYGEELLGRPQYVEKLKQRAQATVRRDKNHACVLIWSIGNENDLTDICVKTGEYVKEVLDPERPVCYPQIGGYFLGLDYNLPSIIDIYAPHYPRTSELLDFYQRSDRPVVFTEYCHSLGISFEDHDRQWEIIERTPWMAGGCVWEWVDQGMPFKVVEKTEGRRYGFEYRVFTSKDGGFEMSGDDLTDGILYANRIPLPNYYELQHNYAQAAVTDSVLATGEPLHVRNRYDFINLKGNVTFNWTLTGDRRTIASGSFSPDCPPHKTVELSLKELEDNGLMDGRIHLLNLEVVDAAGRVINRQSIPVNPSRPAQRLLSGLTENTGDPMSLVQGNPLVRAGRKATLTEMKKAKDHRLERYLLKVRPDGTTDGPVKAAVSTKNAGNAVRYSFSLTPTDKEAFLSELGLALLLDPKIDRAQWIGNGPVPTYPGRSRAGRYGFWSLHKDDLYFEGNRRGVDAALLTDAEGDGILLICDEGNVSFEQTDRGIVLTFNAAVAGIGPKFARTAFPVAAGTVTGDFYLYRVEAGRMPRVLKDLFTSPDEVPTPFHPFLTQYDTYLMRFDDIVQ